MVLPLNPSSLEILNDALHEFRQIGKRITALSQTAKGAAYRDTMSRLSMLLEEIPSVRLESRRPGQLECKTMVNLSRFKSLQYLEIDEVFPPLIQNLRDKVGPRLVQLICLNSGVTTLRDLLVNKPSGDEDAEVEQPSDWSELNVLDCSYNQIVEIDASLHALVNVRRVALAHNLIRKIENLDHCIKLGLLDLGFNKIASVQDIHFVLGGLKVLILCNNQIKTTSSLDKLYSLEKLDLSNNAIDDPDEIKRLSELPLLVYLNTLGNPACIRNRTRASSREECYRHYRREIVAHFITERSDINDRLKVFDEQPVSEEEIHKALQAKRKEKPAADRYSTLTPTRPATSTHSTSEPSQPRRGSVVDESTALIRLRPSNAGGMAIASIVGTTTEPELAASVNNQPSSVPADLLVRPKKKKKKRVAVIEAVGSPASPQQRPPKSEPQDMAPRRGKGSPDSAKPQQTPEKEPQPKPEESPSKDKGIDTEFVAKIEELHKQGGTMWLLALNEMQRKEYEAEQRAKEREQREVQIQQARKSSVSTPPATQKNDASLKILEEIKSGKILQLSSSPEIASSPKAVASSPDDDETAATEPAHELSQSKERENAAEKSSTPANSRINLDANEDITTDEFTVEVGGQLRILLVSKRYVVEADVTTGRDVVSHQAKYITSVKSVSMGGRPAVHVEYSPPRAGTETRTEVKDTATYILDDEEEREQLLTLLQAFLAQNSQARVQCMRCLKIYDRLAGMQACRSCGSTYVVHYEEEKKKSKTPPASTSPQPSTSAPADALKVTIMSGDTETSRRGEVVMKASTREDFSSDTMDVNLQLHLRLTFFRGGAAEQLVYFFTSVYLPYGAKTSEEAIGHLLITTQNMYILQRKRRPTETDPGFALVAEYRLSQIRRVVIGLFYQHFRVEIDEKQAFVFLSKEHARTHAFIDLLLQTILDSDGVGGEPIEAVHYNSETLGNMQTQLFYRFPSKALQVYVLLYQKMPAARPKSMLLGSTLSAARDMGGLVTRAMIITSTHIILATEDYSRWPALHYPSVKPPSSPQFEISSAHEISELVSLELDAQDTTEFKVVFEKESTGAKTTIQLKTEHAEERSKLTNSLAKLWEAMFKLPLSLKYYNIPN